MSQEKSTVVIGGGIIGAMCAWYLRRSGHTVTIVEADGFGQGCSWANCGFVCPSHILPLTTPGAVGKALRGLVRRNSPFSIRPRLSWSLWHWLANFARRCNQQAMLEAAPAIHELLHSSRQLYAQLLAEWKIQCQWQQRGLLFVYQDAHEFEAYRDVDRLLQEHFGVAATAYPGDQVCELEPALKPGLGGGWHYPGDGHLRPDALMAGLRDLLIEQGVQLIEHTKVTGFRVEGNQARCATTARGEVEGQTFVVATGALTPSLSRWLGMRIPIQPGKGYSITTSLPSVVPTIPMILEQHSVGVTPFEDGYRLGSTMEFAGYDTSIRPRRLQLLRDGARIYLHQPYTEQVQSVWYGWRPMTWDGKPIVDRSPAMLNTWIAAGHNMLGLSMAPATGKLIAELVNGQPPHLDPQPLTCHRFRTRTPA